MCVFENGTGPLPHPVTQRQYHMGGRVGERPVPHRALRTASNNA